MEGIELDNASEPVPPAPAKVQLPDPAAKRLLSLEVEVALRREQVLPEYVDQLVRILSDQAMVGKDGTMTIATQRVEVAAKHLHLTKPAFFQGPMVEGAPGTVRLPAAPAAATAGATASAPPAFDPYSEEGKQMMVGDPERFSAECAKYRDRIMASRGRRYCHHGEVHTKINH